MFYEKARNILETNGASNNPDLAIAYYQIGDAYWARGDYWNALNILEKALKIQEDTLLPSDLSISRTCASLANVSYDLRYYKQAFEYLERATEIARQNKTPAGAEFLKKCLDFAKHMGIKI